MRGPEIRSSWLLVLLLGIGTAGMASAQGQVEKGAPNPSSRDKRVFDRVYQVEAPVFRRSMRLADATAWPVFYGSVPAAWLGTWLVRGSDVGSDAYRLTLSELGALGVSFGLKMVVRRTRPYVRYPDVASRTGDIARWDPHSFPSGHAAISFALVTSWTLSHPHWYIAVPGYLWATSVAVSRIWLGVHYPSDILAGALVGVVVAWGVHALGAAITPSFLEKSERVERPAVPLFRLSLRSGFNVP